MSTNYSLSAGTESTEDEKKSAPYGPAIVLFILNIIIIKSASLEQFQEIGLGDRWTFHYKMMWMAASIIIAILILSWITCVTIVSENNGCACLVKGLGYICMVGIFICMCVQYILMGNLWHTDPEHTIMFYHKYWTEGVTNMNQSPVPFVNDTTTMTATTTTSLNTTVVANTTRALQGLATVIITPTIRLRGSISTVRRLRGSISTVRRLRGSISTVRRLLKTTLASKWVYVMSDVVIRIYGFMFMVLPVILALMLCGGGSAYICGRAFK